ncbi:MAG: DUF2974 domain-containing protein [Eubacteriales bacterium]|nr:DUF2974 domain-containing protein [Eubacteriales bacterium]
MAERRKAANFITYARDNLEPFSRRYPCEVDSMIFSDLAYLHFQEPELLEGNPEGVALRDIFRAENFPAMLHEVWSTEENIELLGALAASPRFRDIRIFGYREELNPERGKQFAAVSFRLQPGLVYVAYRGTDWTMTGWKEDFKLSLTAPIPAQKEALEYLNRIAAEEKGTLILGGHSKGGNLAVYAASNCPEEIQVRIHRVYSHDGPGFYEEDLAKPGYSRIRERIQKNVPQFSVFGMLFEQEAEPKVIESNGMGVWQHNMMSWEVIGTELKERKKPDAAAKKMLERLNAWVYRISPEDKALFIDTVFDLLYATGVESVDDIRRGNAKTLTMLFRNYRDMDEEMRYFLKHILLLLISGDLKDSELIEADKVDADDKRGIPAGG